eukprot:5454339-Amphidinium_carterae.2
MQAPPPRGHVWLKRPRKLSIRSEVHQQVVLGISLAAGARVSVGRALHRAKTSVPLEVSAANEHHPKRACSPNPMTFQATLCNKKLR